MEDRSDISSISHISNQPNEIPTINIEEFLLQQHARSLSSIHSNDDHSFPKIFTVAQTLKDPLILNHIKPDYGSLGEFVGDLNLSKDLLNQKKRKNDVNQEQIEEKRIRFFFQDKTKSQLNDVYLSKTSSALQKKVAGKLLVQNLFKDSFGVTLTSFESQNAKPEPPKSYKISLSSIDDIFMGKKLSSNTDDEKSNKKDPKIGEDQLELEKAKAKRKDVRRWTKHSKLQTIQSIKSKYPFLRKLQLKQQCAQYSKLFPKEEQEQSEFNYKIMKKEQEIEKPLPTHIFEIDNVTFHLQKLTIKPQLMLYIVSNFELDKIQILDLNQVRISEETLCFFLEIVKTFCLNLTRMSLSCISLQKVGNLAVKVREILQILPIDELNMNCMDLQTKAFCIICLGIGNNKTLHSLNLDNNGIDERGCKSLELISKHCQNLRKIYLRKNFIKNHHLSYFPTEARGKISL